MKKRQIVIELTSLLDVILIMLFMVMVRAEGKTTEAMDNAKQNEAALETLSGEYAALESAYAEKASEAPKTEYRDVKGQMGFTVYLGEAGSVPCIIIHRRSMDSKFKNPENYLNNVFREFLENKYEEKGGSVGTNPAKTWEIGGKKLIGARYYVKNGDVEVTQLQLIEIRDQGDVEYTGMYRNEEEEKLVMDALNAAVANFAED